MKRLNRLMNLGCETTAGLPEGLDPGVRATSTFTWPPHSSSPYPDAVIHLTLFLPIVLMVFLLGISTALADPKFRASKIEGRGSELVFCDLDGDHLKDIALIERTNLALYYQDANRGFGKEADQRYGLGNQPTLVSVAHLGPGADSLLLLTSEGVAELCCTNRTSPPALKPIIRQPTAIPPRLDESAALAMHFQLSVDAGTDAPLVLVPIEGGLQVWQQGQDWRLVRTLEGAMDQRLSPSIGDHPGYTRSLGLCLGVADLNGDGREDLVVRRRLALGTETYAVYLQGTNGLFAAEPTLTHESKPDWRCWFGWVDLNRDGKVDLLKSTWLDERWFVPGVRSGKVLVGIYLANEHGQFPSDPQQVFRKNDWTPSLPVLDIDGDGFPDLAMGYSLFDSREGARKMITAKQLDFRLKFHFFRPGIGFPREPDCQRDLLIHLDRHSLHLGWDRRESFERFVHLNSDFNGDGKRDLLVRDHSDRVSVYCFVSRERGFSQEAGLRFNCPEPIDWLETQDLNHDGVADLTVGLQKRNGFRVFLSARRAGDLAPDREGM